VSISQINQSIHHIDHATKSNVNNIAVQTYNIATTLVNSNKDVNFDLVLTDIMMPKLDGQ